MNGAVAPIERPLSSAPTRMREAISDAQADTLLRLATFLALAAFALGHWQSVVQGASAGRAVALLAICGAGAAALWLTGERELPRLVVVGARVLIVLTMAIAAALVTGLPARYLHHWGAFGDHLNHGLLVAQSTTYPYAGEDKWVRLTLLLTGPAFLVPAAALAFWPARRAAGALRAASLVLLILLFGMAVADRSPSGEVGRGFALLLLIAAWLWLPRLKLQDAGPAAGVVIAAALVALPVAAKLDGKSWLDYRSWHVLGNTPGVHYRWDHNYGPINWPRRGTTLLYMQARHPLYWKAETLDDFDGRGWLRTSARTSVGAASELPSNPDHRWFQQVKVTVAGLRGNQVVGAGTPQSVSSGAGDTELSGDGTVTTLDHPLREGENYSLVTYLPEPSAAEMRESGQDYEGYFGIYTRLTLPEKVEGGVTEPERFDPGLWRGNNGDPAARDVALNSPYAPMYRLAQRLAARSPTPYDMARSVENYLNTSRFAYDEHPTPRKYPLESFLFKDRVGYCQQFSGTMAMMLRMVGIPARVATGFAPGSPQPKSPGVYRVRDFDAHSWVEVYFTDIGWVTFDPTPSASPASSQTDDHAIAAAAGAGRAPRPPGQSQEHDPLGDTATGGLAPSSGSSLSWWMVPAAIGALVLLALAGWRLRRAARRRAQLPPDERALDDLCAALFRLGNPVARGATLKAVERTLERRAGPDAARYARQLREYRYGAGGASLPGARDRRALRRALARTARPFGLLKALRALPPLRL